MKDNWSEIPNDLIEILYSEALSRNEARVLLLIARKTYGFHKKSDQISLSQFQNKLGLSRQGTVSILKRLQLVKLCRLVHKGDSRLASSEWAIDTSDYADKLVKLSGLVKFSSNKLVNIRRHTKESYTKENNIGNNFSSRESYWDSNIDFVLRSIQGATPKDVDTARREFIGASKYPPSQFAMKSFINQKLKNLPIQKGGPENGEHFDPFEANRR